ncbi:formyl transferase [bacterium]|nr:formyl transferase [bacterium]
MKILYLGNNRIGLNVLKWLKTREENIVGLVIHPPEKAKFAKEMQKISGLMKEMIFLGNGISQSDCLNKIKSLSPDIGISVNFGYTIKKEFLDIFPQGCINLHTSYLPYNRGAHPNIWSIIEETPAGVTLHYIDEGIDTGDIIAQKEIKVEFNDTGETLYHKLEDASLKLFQGTWEDIKNSTNRRIKPVGKGTYHRTKDIEKIDCIDLNSSYKAKDLLNILRARTFSPYKGAYCEAEGKKIYLQLELGKEKEE